jgi:hypothetical protein
MSDNLPKQLKTALDETRLLVLGVQVLLGFQFQVFFQDGFSDLQVSSRYISLTALMLLVLSIALLITPSMLHQLVERGNSSSRLLRSATLCAGAALVPLAISLGLAAYVVISRSFGMPTGIFCGLLLWALSVVCWFGLELAAGIIRGEKQMKRSVTPLATKVEQMLTEARVILPGAQALFGFQFVGMLTMGFDRLPASAKVLHTVALCSVALNVVLLMTPAALHRLSFDGENTGSFLKLGSVFLIVAPIPLALGISAEIYVVFLKVLENPIQAVAAAGGGAVILLGFWYVLPLIDRSLNEANHGVQGTSVIRPGQLPHGDVAE